MNRSTEVEPADITLTDDLSTTGVIALGAHAGGAFITGTKVGSPTEGTWYASYSRSGDYVVVTDAAGAALAATAVDSDQAIPFREEVVSFPFLKFVLDTGSLPVRVVKKS